MTESTTEAEPPPSPRPSPSPGPGPGRPSTIQRVMRLLVTLMLAATIGVVTVIGLSGAVVAHRAEGRIIDAPTTVAPATAAIVPGATIFPDGTPSLTVQDRLDGALLLYELGTVDHILVSGDNREEHYNEPVAMRNALVAEGVPPEAVSLDYAGLDTWDTCIRAREQFGLTDAVIVTQQRYAPRTAALCSAAGIDIQVLAVEPPAFQRRTTKVLRQTRETMAKVKAFGDIIRTPPARHGGPAIGLVGSRNMPENGHPPDWDWVTDGPADG